MRLVSYLVALALLGCSALFVNGQYYNNYGRQYHSECLRSYSTYFPPPSSQLIVDIFAHFRCPPGYELEGDDVTYCHAEASRPLKRTPRCIIKETSCPEIYCDDSGLDVANAVMLTSRQSRYERGSVIKYRCADENRYCMIGTETRTCLPNGSWSHAPSCKEALCFAGPMIPRVGSGIHIQTSTENKLNPGRTHYYHGGRIQYCCDSGYHSMQGDSFAECICESGNWSRPAPISCQPPNQPPVQPPVQPPIQPPVQPPCRSSYCPWSFCPPVACPPPPQPMCPPAPCVSQPCPPMPCCNSAPVVQGSCQPQCRQCGYGNSWFGAIF